jgi:hypothetical protein
MISSPANLRSLKQVLLPLLLGLLILLGGCVRYEVGLDFNEQHQGAIVQHIELSEQLTNLSQTEAQNWLKSIENRAHQLGGKVKHLSSREVDVTIPFGNGQELTERFNEFFNPRESKSLAFTKLDNPELVQLKAELAIAQSNWLLLERDRIDLTVDLRALGVLSNQGNIIVSPGSLVDLQFVLTTPWGSKNLIIDDELSPLVISQGNQLIWQLKPGQINRIEAVFWVPSYLGLGILAVIGLTLGGYYFKYKALPGVTKKLAH